MKLPSESYHHMHDHLRIFNVPERLQMQRGRDPEVADAAEAAK